MSDNAGCGSTAAEVEHESVNKEKMQAASSSENDQKEITAMQARVGAHAPDFQTEFYFKGKFGNFKLSDHLGSWVMLCFYPGDFTFV